MPLKTITIAVDAMGGDHGPQVVIPASLQVLNRQSNLKLILVGDQSIIEQHLAANKLYSQLDSNRVVVQHASQQVAMHESPSVALRKKKDSSMRVAINLVHEQTADACVSAGNTGALMATARFVLKTLPRINRPAIISTMPTMNPHKDMRMLDLGADVDSSAENLFQFAVMASVLTSAIDNVVSPKIYLLNIGVEDIKGNEQVKQAAQLISQASSLNYAGFIEGDDIYKGEADIVVCDGFVGNVALKTTEGVAVFIGKLLKKAFNRNILTRLAGIIAMPVLKSLAKSIDPDRYNGASFIGLRGIVVKSHGGAKENAFAHAIEVAIQQVEQNIPQRIGVEVERLMSLSESAPSSNQPSSDDDK